MNNKKSGLLVIITIILISIIALGVVIYFSKNEQGFGSGNISLQSSVQKADICQVSATQTTTLCKWYNGDEDGGNRIINSIVFYSDSLAFATDTALTLGTTTVNYATSSNLGNFWTIAIDDPAKLTSSTAAGYYSTSTYVNAGRRLWTNGLYAIAQLTKIATTTGYIKILYDKN